MTNSAFQDFRQRLGAAGLRTALADLLQRSDYRFLAIFRFEEGRATAAAFVDRARPEQAWTDEVPANATYCCYVRDARGAFTTADALARPGTDRPRADDAGGCVPGTRTPRAALPRRGYFAGMASWGGAASCSVISPGTRLRANQV
jgi:hypothetical protein